MLLAALTLPPLAAQEAPHPVPQKVTVTDFTAGKEYTHASIRDAVKAMAASTLCSRAVATCPITGQQVRVIRTGVKWVTYPKDAVFLLLGARQSRGPDLVFPGQRQYIQYLARHPDAAAQKPKPLRIAQALKEITSQPKAEPAPAAAPATAARTP